MSLVDPDSAIVITGVAFSDNGMEVTYLEKREQTENVGMMRTVFIDTIRCRMQETQQEILDSVVDVVENALVILRNPDPQFDPRKRFRDPARKEVPATE